MRLIIFCLSLFFVRFGFSQNSDSLWLNLKVSAFEKPAKDVFAHALNARRKVQDSLGVISNPLVCIIDFRLKSTKKRMWVLNIDSLVIVDQNLVAHGKNTGQDRALYFSNKIGSYQSSLGVFITKGTYIGKHGNSLTMAGIDSGWNTNAQERAIVMHTATYASRLFINKYDRLGRSHGCPAIPVKNKYLIDDLANGAIIFIYANQYKSVWIN